MEPEKWPEALGADNKQPIIYKDESAEILRVASMSAFSSDKKIFVITATGEDEPGSGQQAPEDT